MPAQTTRILTHPDLAPLSGKPEQSHPHEKFRLSEASFFFCEGDACMSSDAMADCAVMLAAATLPTLCRVWQSQTLTSLLSWTMALPGVVSLLRWAQISINTTAYEPACVFPLYIPVELMGLLSEM